MNTSISFLGGAGTVTGSKNLVTVQNSRVLIDCGLFQGHKEDRLRNWNAFPMDPKQINAVVLTHAHLDHCGYLPLLVKQGFDGPIYCSPPTAELTKIVLLDAANLQLEDAKFFNQNGLSKHQPARPLFNIVDAEAVFSLLVSLDLDHWQEVPKSQIKIRLKQSGHILGSTIVEVDAAGTRIVFSGDLGREHPLTLEPREIVDEADILVVESTYGDRSHPKQDSMQSLAEVINATMERSGHIVIPAFAIGRTQDILHLIALLRSKGAIPNIPIYLDSPKADQANQVFDDFPNWHKLSSLDLRRLQGTCHRVSDAKQSRFLCKNEEPSVVIAGSGMLTGGRVLHHLLARISDERNTIALVGYQAAGTRGRRLLDGTRELKIFGKTIPVRAQIIEIPTLSAHADQGEIINWIAGFKKKPKQIFLVHGERQCCEGLRSRIRVQFKIESHIAILGETIELN
jgi:metallo-beta-lactamase family protein